VLENTKANSNSQLSRVKEDASPPTHFPQGVLDAGYHWHYMGVVYIEFDQSDVAETVSGFTL
jgi:hypothetical protein